MERVDRNSHWLFKKAVIGSQYKRAQINPRLPAVPHGTPVQMRKGDLNRTSKEAKGTSPFYLSITIVIKSILCAGVCQPVLLNICSDKESLRPIINIFNSVITKITVKDMTLLSETANRSYYGETIRCFYNRIDTYRSADNLY